MFHKEATGMKFHRSSSHKATLCLLGSFMKRHASGTLSANKWQRVVQRVTTNYNEWQRVKTNDSK